MVWTGGVGKMPPPVFNRKNMSNIKYLLAVGCMLPGLIMFSSCSDSDKDYIPPALDEIEGPEELVTAKSYITLE